MYEVFTTSTLDDRPLATFDSVREARDFAQQASRFDLFRGYLVYTGRRLVAEYDRGKLNVRPGLANLS